MGHSSVTPLLSLTLLTSLTMPSVLSFTPLTSLTLLISHTSTYLLTNNSSFMGNSSGQTFSSVPTPTLYIW